MVAHRRAAARTLAIEAGRKMFGEEFRIDPVHNPLAEYAALAGRVMAWMRTMETLTAKLTAPGYSGATGEQVFATVQLFERAMDRANTVLSTYAKLGIDERLARVTEAQAQMVIRAIEAALHAAGLSGAAVVEAKKAVGRHLTLVDGDAG